jgi:nucleoside-diphosphate-sugar epimerase
MHLVTGGAGFFGSLLAKRLASEGEEVRVLDLWAENIRSDDIEYVIGDIRNESVVRKALKDVKFVHHCAGKVPLTKNKNDLNSVNIVGTQIISKLARENNVSKFVHFSSSAIYGIPEIQPIVRNTLKKPLEPYGESKLASEIIVRENFFNSNTSYLIIRPRTIIGPGRLGIFGLLFDWISNGKNVYTIGRGEKSLQFIHANDLINGYLLALEKLDHAEVNIGTDRYDNLNNELLKLIQTADSSSKIIHLPDKPTRTALEILDKLRISPLAPYHYLTYGKNIEFDLSELKSIGWTPKYSTSEMLNEAYMNFTNQGIKNFGLSPHKKTINQGILRIIRKFL